MLYTLNRDAVEFGHSSGEFHTFRLPVPSLWPDILQKAKAAGLNAVSVYTHMGLINPSPGVVDFDGFRALQPLFDAARDAGIFIVLRPGPYINAETTAGGASSVCRIFSSFQYSRQGSLIGPPARLRGIFVPVMQTGKQPGRPTFKASSMLRCLIRSQREDLS